MENYDSYNIRKDVLGKIYRKRLEQCNQGYTNKELAKLWGCKIETVSKWKSRYWIKTNKIVKEKNKIDNIRIKLKEKIRKEINNVITKEQLTLNEVKNIINELNDELKVG